MALVTPSVATPRVAANPPPYRSFADVVSGNTSGGDPVSPRTFSKSFSGVVNNGGSVELKQPGIFKGEPAVFFTESEISKLASPFRFTLVGKFSFRRPTMDVIRKFFASLGLKSLKSVGLLQENHIVIFINNEEDYARLLLRATWYVQGFPMKIIKWSTDFCPGFESPVVPVWIALPGLPLHFFDKSALFSLASVFGFPIKIDEATANLTRPTVARICVDLDVSKPNPNRFWIGDDKNGFWQDVVFEDPPSYCGFCAKLGHDEAACYVKNPNLKSHMGPAHDPSTNNLKIKTVSFSIPSSKEDNRLKGKMVTDNPDGGVEEAWNIQKSKRWKKKETGSNSKVLEVAESSNTASREVVEVEKSPLEAVACIRVALTPFNPSFKIPKSTSQPLNNTSGLQKFSNPSSSSSVKKGQAKAGDPAQTVEKIQPQSQHLFCSNQSSVVNFSDKEPASLLKPLDKEVGLQIGKSQPLDLSLFPINSSQQHISRDNNRDLVVSIPPPIVSVVELNEPSIYIEEEEVQRSICVTSGSHGGFHEKDLQIQPTIALTGGPREHFSGNSIEFQPLIEAKLQLQPPISIDHGSHKMICEKEVEIQPQQLSLTCERGSHKQFDEHSSTLNPLVVEELQSLPSDFIPSGGVTCGNKLQFSSNIGPELLDGLVSSGSLENQKNLLCLDFGQEKSIEESSPSSGPILMDNIVGPNDLVVTNSLGQFENIQAGPEHSEGDYGLEHSNIPPGQISSPSLFNQINPISLVNPLPELEEHTNFLFLKQPLFFHLTSCNIVLKSLLKKAFCHFLSLSGAYLKQFSKGVFNWVCIKNCCIQFLRLSKISVTWQLRRAIEQFFNCVSSSSKVCAQSSSNSSVNKPYPDKSPVVTPNLPLPGSLRPCVLNTECSIPSSQSQFQPIKVSLASDSDEPSEDYDSENNYVEEVHSKWEKKMKFNRDFPVARKPRIHEHKPRYKPPTHSSGFPDTHNSDFPQMESDEYDHQCSAHFSE